jgi:hypothetical protein
MLPQQNSAVAYGWSNRVILTIECNVHDMLFLHGHLLATLVSESLLFALSFLSVGQQQHLS